MGAGIFHILHGQWVTIHLAVSVEVSNTIIVYDLKTLLCVFVNVKCFCYRINN